MSFAVSARPLERQFELMDTVRGHPANARIIRSLCRKRGGDVSIIGPDSHPDPYLGCGSHPEIVERVWDQLGRGLPTGRRILCGTPILIQPTTGVILAVCFGTRYCLRLPDGVMTKALQAGCTTSQRWTGGGITDLSSELGPNWVFGCWAHDEASWCQAVAASDATT